MLTAVLGKLYRRFNLSIRRRRPIKENQHKSLDFLQNMVINCLYFMIISETVSVFLYIFHGCYALSKSFKNYLSKPSQKAHTWLCSGYAPNVTVLFEFVKSTLLFIQLLFFHFWSILNNFFLHDIWYNNAQLMLTKMSLHIAKTEN